MAVATALQLKAARATPAPSALITTPCQVWSRWTYALPYYSVFAADTLLYAVTLNFDLWPWTFAAYHLWRDETLYHIWTQLSNPRRSYCDLRVWPYDLEHYVTVRVALGSGIIFTKFDPSSWYITYVIKVCTKFEWNRAIPGWIIDNFANFCTCYIVLWPWPLPSWPWTFRAFRLSYI